MGEIYGERMNRAPQAAAYGGIIVSRLSYFSLSP